MLRPLLLVKACIEALDHNANQIQLLLGALKDVIGSCTFAIHDMTKVLKEWANEWKAEEVHWSLHMILYS